MRRFFLGMALIAVTAVPGTFVQADEAQDIKIGEVLKQRLKAEKAAKRLEGAKFDWQVEDGKIFLSGLVANAEQEKITLAVAQQVPGVVEVTNDLQIAGAKPAPQATPVATAGPKVSAYDAPEGAESIVEDDVVAAADNQTVEDKSAGQDVVPASVPAMFASTPVGARPGQARPQGVQQVQHAAPAPGYAPQPGYGGQQGGPVPFARAAQASHMQPMAGPMGPGPVPMQQPGAGVRQARYDNPQMPGYAWPSYAAYPNYAGVSYPKQYSASAWPYMGPFYPYPQVPLGWRRVSLEWKDGWWWLDFKDRYRNR